jgi:hypothetical protein
MVCGGFDHFQTHEQLSLARTGAHGWNIWPGRDWLAIRYERGYNCISSPEIAVRTTPAPKLGGYKEALPHSGDVGMWMCFAAYADVGYFRDADQAYYHIRAMRVCKVGSGFPTSTYQDGNYWVDLTSQLARTEG